MKTDFRRFFPAVILLLWSAAARADGWNLRYWDTVAKAKADGEPILLAFTGSDWDPPSQKMIAETLYKPDFLAYAKGKFELLTVDFPQTNRPVVLGIQNDRLRVRFGVDNLPTFILLTSNGQKPLWRYTGAPNVGPQAFINILAKHYHPLAPAAVTGSNAASPTKPAGQ